MARSVRRWCGPAVLVVPALVVWTLTGPRAARADASPDTSDAPNAPAHGAVTSPRAFAAKDPVRLAGASALSPDTIIRRWADGPVRYLMTQGETDTVLRMQTVPELARFITDFWARRDPTPQTVENEFRRTYWERVIESNRRFRDSTVPGWKTDRGKVFVMLGPPDDVVFDEHPAIPYGLGPMRSPSEGDDVAMRGVERWSYPRRRSKSADAVFVVAFVRDPSLDWRLATDPNLLRPVYPGSAMMQSPITGQGSDSNVARSSQNPTRGAGPGSPGFAERVQAQVLANEPGRLNTSVFANYDLGLEMAVPSSAETMMAVVDAQDFIPGFLPEPRFEFFRARDGTTYVNAGVLLDAKDVYGDLTRGQTALRIYASLTPVGDPDHPSFASNETRPFVYDLAHDADPGGQVAVWTGLALRAGRYRVTLAVEDSLTGQLGRVDDEVEVPEFASRRPSISTLVLASEVSQYGGRLGVTARTSGIFRKSEDFAVYYEVYGTDVAGGRPRFDVVYRFYREMKDSLRPVGDPIPFPKRTEGGQAWTFPLRKWPTGPYRLEVIVTDEAGRTITAEAHFQVSE